MEYLKWHIWKIKWYTNVLYGLDTFKEGSSVDVVLQKWEEDQTEHSMKS